MIFIQFKKQIRIIVCIARCKNKATVLKPI